MVSTNNINTSTLRAIDCFWWQQCSSTIYLYTFLNIVRMKKEKNNPIKTVLTIVVGLTIIYMITKLQWTIIAALTVGFTSLMSKQICRWVDFVWRKLAWILSLIIPNILLSIIYYFLLFPISLLAKLFGKKDPLCLKNEQTSMFVSVNKKFGKRSFEIIW